MRVAEFTKSAERGAKYLDSLNRETESKDTKQTAPSVPDIHETVERLSKLSSV